MRGYVRFILAVMLAAVAGVGSARGEEGLTNEQEFNDGTIKWRVRFSTYNLGWCAIGPSGSSKLPSTVTIPSEVFGTTVVGIIECAFMGHSEITEVRIPPSVEMIGHDAFWDCSGLMSVTIPSSVTSIRGGAFADCSGLTSVTIPAGVTTIGDGAFSGCSGLASVVIPSSVATIGDGVFSGCRELQTIKVESGNPRYYSEEGVLFELVKDYKRGVDVKALMCYPAGRAGEYRIPGDVEMVASGAFSGCSGLASVTIPEGVTTIEHVAFSGCSKLTSVTIPEGVTTIESSAFEGCSGLQRIAVASGNPRYYDKDGVLFGTEHDPMSGKEVKALILYPLGRPGACKIPADVEKVESSDFSGCSGLQRIEVEPGNPRYHDENGVLFGFAKDYESGVEVKSLVRYPAGRSGEYKIPDDVRVIGWGAFSGCSKLNKVTFSGRVELCDFYLFDGCIALEEIAVESHDANDRYYTKDGVLFSRYSINGGTRERTYETTLVRCPRGKRGAYEIPTGVEVIGEGAFAGCSQLTDITIPTGVKEIHEGTFFGCSELTRLTIPATVEDIDFSFSGIFTKLEEFVVDAANPSYCAKGGGAIQQGYALASFLP